MLCVVAILPSGCLQCELELYSFNKMSFSPPCLIMLAKN